MSDKWLLAALGLYSQSLAPSVKRELYFLSTVVLSQILGLRLWVDLEALSTAPESPTRFWPVGCADWLGLYCLPLSLLWQDGGWRWGQSC